jgi:hypothetical protein
MRTAVGCIATVNACTKLVVEQKGEGDKEIKEK